MVKTEAGTQGPLTHPSFLQDHPPVFGFRPVAEIPGGVQARTLGCTSQCEGWLSHSPCGQVPECADQTKRFCEGSA